MRLVRVPLKAPAIPCLLSLDSALQLQYLCPFLRCCWISHSGVTPRGNRVWGSALEQGAGTEQHKESDSHAKGLSLLIPDRLYHWRWGPQDIQHVCSGRHKWLPVEGVPGVSMSLANLAGLSTVTKTVLAVVTVRGCRIRNSEIWLCLCLFFFFFANKCFSDCKLVFFLY